MRHPLHILATVLLSVVTTSNAHGQLLPQHIGSPSCGQWMRGHDQYKHGYLLGALSGLNYMWATMEIGRLMNDPEFVKRPKPRPDVIATLQSGDQAFQWMDNYCRQNPRNDVMEGATSLYTELLAKQMGVRIPGKAP